MNIKQFYATQLPEFTGDGGTFKHYYTSFDGHTALILQGQNGLHLVAIYVSFFKLTQRLDNNQNDPIKFINTFPL